VALGASTCFSPVAPASTCWSSGGGRSGSVVSAPGAGSAGADPSGPMARGPMKLRLAQCLRIPLGSKTRGLGSRSWLQLEVRGTCSTNEVEVSQHISRKIKIFAAQPEADLQYRFLLNGSLHPHCLTRRPRCWRWGFTSLRRGPRHGDGDGCSGHRAPPFFFGLGPGGGRGRTTRGCYKYDSTLRYCITTNQ
jgi:hypothetical protein